MLARLARIEDDGEFSDALLAYCRALKCGVGNPNHDHSNGQFASADMGGGGGGSPRKDQGRSREPSTRGQQDQFGHLPDKHGRIDPENNIARGHRAIGFLQQPGQRVEKAMFRQDVGAVGMEYGDPDHDSGWGKSHIESKHGKDALARVPEIIQHGTLFPHAEEHKRYILHGESLVVLGRKSKNQAWTVTSYESRKTVDRVKAEQQAKGGTP